MRFIIYTYWDRSAQPAEYIFNSQKTIYVHGWIRQIFIPMRDRFDRTKYVRFSKMPKPGFPTNKYHPRPMQAEIHSARRQMSFPAKPDQAFL